MSRTLLTALAAIALVGLTAPAHADGWYFTEGFGLATVRGPMADSFAGDRATHFRVGVGRKVDNLALEAYVSLVSPLDGRGRFQGSRYDAVTYGLDLRYLVPLTGPVSGYVRGGLNKMNLDGGGSFRDPGGSAYAGRGLSWGSGVQVSGEVRAAGLLFWPLFFTDWGPKVTAAVWLDTGRQRVRLHHPTARSLDGDLATWTFGVGVGSDF